MFFRFLFISLPLLDVLWWLWADRRVRALPHRRWWRVALGAFAALQLVVLGGMVLGRMTSLRPPDSSIVMAVVFVWHLLVLPLTMIAVVLASAGRDAIRVGRWAVCRLAVRPAPTNSPADPPAGSVADAGLSRRQFLGASAALTAPLLTGGLTGLGMWQVQHFRVRPIVATLPSLPAALDGLVIAHVSDSHVGRLTHGRLLKRITQAVNDMNADLVLFTGDLINDSLDDLSVAADMLRRMKSRYGLCAIEGNHDLFEDRFEFESGVRDAGISLLLNDSLILEVRGQSVQLLGLRWGDPRLGRGAEYARNFGRVLPMLQPGAFPILLSHHPDVFDLSARAGIPLTLSGHTHGGQLMLTPTIGPAPLMFKYWSGLYEQNGSSLVVSNGVGNWFPLRLNAPAEIIRLELRRGNPVGDSRVVG